MHTFETVDAKEARRFRVAQFNGRSIPFKLNGSEVPGLVRSILERTSDNVTRWTITIIPSIPPVKRSLSRIRPAFFVQDEQMDVAIG
jgi:hypothetical protein